MMFRKDYFSPVSEFFLDQFLHPNPLANPKRRRHQEGAQSGRRVGEITVQNAVELQKWLFVERDKIEIADFDAALAQAVFDRVRRKRRVVFLARETFLLRGRNNLSIPNQTRRAVVIKRGDTQN